MIFNKPIWAPNMILIDSPISGIERLDIALDVLQALNNKQDVIGIFASDGIKNVEREKIVIKQLDYSIYRESNTESPRLRSQFLKQGSKIVYYVISPEREYRSAIVNVYDLINTEYPVVCISEYLNKDIMPAAIVVPTTDDKIHCINTNVPAAKKDKIYTLNEFLGKQIFFEDQVFRIEDRL